MILVDANLLIYVLDSDSPHHAAATKWWNQQLSQTEPVCLAWVVILSVIRITTNSRIFKRPLSAEQAVRVIESWLAQPCVRIVQPSESHWTFIQSLLRAVPFHYNLVNDAHLAALAIENNAELCSSDRDFEKSPGLRWSNPLRPVAP